MRLEIFSSGMTDELQTALVDFRHDKDLYNQQPIGLLGAYYMYAGSEGLKQLPHYESLPGSIPIFYEDTKVSNYRNAVNKNTAAVVLGNMVLSLRHVLDEGKLDFESFRQRHEAMMKGTIMEKKISLAGVSMPAGRVKPSLQTLREKALTDPTLFAILTSYYHLPYELEMVMQRSYKIPFDDGRMEEQSPIGRYVTELLMHSFKPVAQDLLANKLQLPIPKKFLEFLDGEEIREDVRTFLTK